MIEVDDAISQYMRSPAVSKSLTRSVSLVLPHIVLTFWFIFVGVAVWRHAARSTQPPIYDALTYAGKAKNVWAALRGKRMLELLHTRPADRPPGSVVMSYPFGFDATFHGFHFRSVFIPFVLACLAVCMAGFRERPSRTAHWRLVCLGLCVSSMPIFFQFEYSDAAPSPVFWGLVDNFMAGVSGVAAAATIQSLRRSSLVWLGVALLASAFSFLIKPAGLLTMGLVTSCFVTMATLGLLSPRLTEAERRRGQRFLYCGILLAALLHGFTVAAAFVSSYLSPANVSFYAGAVALLRRDMVTPVTVRLLHRSIHTSIGYPLLASLLLATVLCLAREQRSGKAGEHRLPGFSLGLAGFAVAAFTLGALFVVETDLTTVRYSVPSVLMGIIFLVPLLLRVSQTAPAWGKTVLTFLWSLPPLSLGCLLLFSAPSVRAQRLAGVNLTSGGTAEEVRQAGRLIEKLRRQDRWAVVYSFYSGSATAAFECVGHWRQLIEPGRPNFRVRLPLDWRRPPAFRLNDIATADYVLFSPLRDPALRRRAVSPGTLMTFEQESALFHALFMDLGEGAGVQVAWDGESARLLRVTNAAALSQALIALLDDYTMRAEFLSANPELAKAKR